MQNNKISSEYPEGNSSQSIDGVDTLPLTSAQDTVCIERYSQEDLNISYESRVTSKWQTNPICDQGPFYRGSPLIRPQSEGHTFANNPHLVGRTTKTSMQIFCLFGPKKESEIDGNQKWEETKHM